jgi:shikimate dehydrogenase
LNRLAVLGHPVSHSLSPAMQSAALEALGLADEWSYEAIEVEAGAFAARVRGLPAQSFVGANVTIPHKRAALELAHRASEAANEIGAANTLSFTDDRIHAENTDASGLLSALPEAPSGKRALVLGAGGSARAVVWALMRQAAPVAVWNRTEVRAAELVRELVGAAAEERVSPVDAEGARAGAFDLIVNCTAVGMGDEDPFEHLPLDPDRLGPGVTMVDLVYAGEESRLVRVARQRGATAVDGLEVLVRQGGESLRIWTGLDPPLEVMRAAARAN